MPNDSTSLAQVFALFRTYRYVSHMPLNVKNHIKALILQLKQENISVDTMDEGHETLLQLAVSTGHIDIVKLLLEQRADVNQRDSAGNNLLYNYQNPALIKLLIEAKADIENRDNEGITPLLYASEFFGYSTSLVELIHAGANVNVQAKHGRTPLSNVSSYSDPISLQMLIDAKADVNMRDKYGAIALTHAVIAGHTENVKALIDAKSDVNIEFKLDTSYRDCLWRSTFTDDQELEILIALLKAGANPFKNLEYEADGLEKFIYHKLMAADQSDYNLYLALDNLYKRQAEYLLSDNKQDDVAATIRTQQASLKPHLEKCKKFHELQQDNARLTIDKATKFKIPEVILNLISQYDGSGSRPLKGKSFFPYITYPSMDRLLNAEKSLNKKIR